MVWDWRKDERANCRSPETEDRVLKRAERSLAGDRALLEVKLELKACRTL